MQTEKKLAPIPNTVGATYIYFEIDFVCLRSNLEFIKIVMLTTVQVPGSPIFLMKMAVNARHLEVQLLADEYGTAISLFSRYGTPLVSDV